MTTALSQPAYASSIDSSSVIGGSDSNSLSSSHPILNRQDNAISQSTSATTRDGPTTSIYKPSPHQVAARAPKIDIPKEYPITTAAIGFATFQSDVHLVNAAGNQDIYPRIWYFSKPLTMGDQDTSAGDDWDWEVKMLEVNQDKLPFIVRRSKVQKAYEIVSLQDGSKSFCRAVKVSSSISLTGNSTKISFEGLNGKTWAWKGSFNRSMILNEYDVDSNGKKVKTPLAEYVRYSSRPILTIEEAGAQRDASLIVASFYPLIDLHREDFKRKYNWPGDSEISEALPAKWDSRIIMMGEKERGERMAKEELERRNGTAVVGGGVNEDEGDDRKGSYETERSTDTKRAGSK